LLVGNNFGTDLGVGLGVASALPDKCPKSIGRVKLLHPKKNSFETETNPLS
jgi:hypothetical protein